VFIEATDDEVLVTVGAISHAKSSIHIVSTNNQHPVFTCQMPCMSPNQHCQSIERKTLHSMELCLLRPHLGSSNFCLWPL